MGLGISVSAWWISSRWDVQSKYEKWRFTTKLPALQKASHTLFSKRKHCFRSSCAMLGLNLDLLRSFKIYFIFFPFFFHTESYVLQAGFKLTMLTTVGLNFCFCFPSAGKWCVSPYPNYFYFFRFFLYTKSYYVAKTGLELMKIPLP